MTRELAGQASLKAIAGSEHSPGVDVRTDDQINAFIRRSAETIYHPVGTCKMGADGDAMAVVDDQLRVVGLKGLRVVDASVMPTITSGNTNTPTIMIAEKGARFVLEDGR
jgi:choline dehydrogenase